MRSAVMTLGALLGVGAVLGLAIVFLGLFNVSARGGHLPLVDHIFHTTYENSVELRAPAASTVPELDDNSLVQLGAAHYEQACSQCHGIPGESQSQTMRSMLPQPPPVRDAVSGWQPEHLFWIVKHGIKMSGMPHWPSLERDDDIWSIVAFLNKVADLDADQYDALLHHSLTTNDMQSMQEAEQLSERGTAELVGQCVNCHGFSGISDNTYIPRLDVLSEQYMNATLRAYRDGQRHSGIMQHAASLLDDVAIEELSKHYATTDFPTQTSAHGSSTSIDSVNEKSASTERGRQLALGLLMSTDIKGTLIAEQDIPVCAACHGPWSEPLSPNYPSLAGQSREYLLSQLRVWKSGKRGGTELAKMMHQVVPDLNDDQMVDLAAYYASLPAASLD